MGWGPYFLWPRFPAAGHGLLDLYRSAGIGSLAVALLRPGLGLQDPDFAQVASTIPPWPHRPGGPHVDGLTPPAPDGRPYPKIELGEPARATGPAGSVLLAHYLLAHNIGNHDGPAGTGERQTVYYRLHASGHVRRWREAVTNPLLEFA